MPPTAVIGIILVIMAGVFSGTALLPMKFTKSWKFENTWLLYSVIAYLISPGIVAVATVPHLGEVYLAAGTKACMLTALFGFAWGIAVVLNGVGVALVGLSLALAILMGSSVAIGSLAPLLLKDPGALLTHTGLMIALCDLVMLAGVLLCAWAGELRGRAQSQKVEARKVTTRGILVCLIAGYFRRSSLWCCHTEKSFPRRQRLTAQIHSTRQMPSGVWRSVPDRCPAYCGASSGSPARPTGAFSATGSQRKFRSMRTNGRNVDHRDSGIWRRSRNVRTARSRCRLADLHVWHHPDLQLLGLDHG
jgi:hypothetical protein